MDRLGQLALSLALVLLAACARPAAPPMANPSAGSAPAAAARINRTLVMAGRAESPSLASRPLRSFGLTSTTVSRIFNAGLALKDGEGNYRPYLAETLPQLNTDSWKVFPGGSMETTYRLRTNLVWHDGTPLTADDFVYAFQLYTNPEIGLGSLAPIGMMDDVSAGDARTLVIRWKLAFADAGNLDAGNAGPANPTGFPPLPRRLLESQLQPGNADAFVSLPFWSTEYVGAGPYRMDRWEAGSYFEGVAFDQHVLGKPKIERIRMLFIPDFNTSVANMLSGEAHITVDDSIRFQQALVLRREWEPRNRGTVLVYPALWRWLYFQQRPELTRPITLLDVRVRKALAHTVDKDALNDALFEGEGILTETPVPPTSAAYAEVDKLVVKYPYDARRAEQLLGEAGYIRGGAPERDSTWTHPVAGRFAFELTTFQSPQNENEMHIVAAGWRQIGIDVAEIVWPANLSSDAQMRNVHPSLSATGGQSGEIRLTEHTTATVPSAQNRWQGTNRGGWTNPEFDRIAEQFNVTLDRRERGALLGQMARVFSDEAAVISLYFNPTTTAFVASLRGPKPAVPDGTMSWDIYDWEWVS
jgi:peptide/nickel transport system substrate-binding protein